MQLQTGSHSDKCATEAWSGNLDPASSESDSASERFGIRIILFYFFIEYLRPQALIPILGYLRFGLLTFFIMSFLCIKNRKIIPWHIPSLRLPIYFILLMAFFVPIATNWSWAWRETKAMVLLLPVLMSIHLFVRKVDHLELIFKTQGYIAIYLMGYAIIHKGRGPGNFIGDENDMALYANCWLPFFIYLYLIASKFKEKLLAALYIGSAVTIVTVSLSRGGFVGLVVVGLVYWWKSARKFQLLLALIIICVIAYLSVDPSYWQEMSTINHTESGTAHGRIETWKVAWSMFLHNPWGVGPGNFPILFGDYQPEDSFSRNMWGRVAHSVWFTLIPELGVLGILLYAKMFIYFLKTTRYLKHVPADQDRDTDHYKELATAMLAALIGYSTTGTFLSALYYPHFWILLALVSAAHITTRNPRSME